MASHSSQLGRMPSSQLGEITVKDRNRHIYNSRFQPVDVDPLLTPLTSCLGGIQNKHCGARNARALLVGSKLTRSAVALDETGLDHLVAVVNLHATAVALYNVALQMHLGACHRKGIRVLYSSYTTRLTLGKLEHGGECSLSSASVGSGYKAAHQIRIVGATVGREERRNVGERAEGTSIKLHSPAIIGQLEGDVLLVKGKAIAHTQAVGVWRREKS